MDVTSPNGLRHRTTPARGAHARGDTASAIRKAATRLFVERGYELTTMKAIAGQVAIQPSAIYKHVDSKETLLREIAQHAIRTLITDTHLAIASTDDVSEQLTRATAAYVVRYSRDPALALIANRELPSMQESALREQLALRAEYATIFEQVVARGVEQRRFDAPMPEVTARAILQMLLGISVLFEDAARAPEEICDFYGELATRMVGATP